MQRSPIRAALNKFSFSVMAGYGHSITSHNIDDAVFIATQSSQYVRGAESGDGVYTNWYGNPSLVENFQEDQAGFMLNTADSSALRFTANGFTVPITVLLYMNFDRFRIGGGFSAAFNQVGNFRPNAYQENIQPWEPSPQRHRLMRYFGYVGATAYSWENFAFVPDLQLGAVSMGSQINTELANPSWFADLGLSVEKHLSEYMRIVVRPSYEYRALTTILQTEQPFPSFQHNHHTFYVQAGISLNYPEVPRCPIKACSTQLKHAHGGKEFRGQPIWKKQNPKYGENDTELIRNKGRNKRKRSAY